MWRTVRRGGVEPDPTGDRGGFDRIVRQKEPESVGFSGSCLCGLRARLCAGSGAAGRWSRIEKSQRAKLDPFKSRESINDHLALLEDEGCGGECRAVGWTPPYRRQERLWRGSWARKSRRVLVFQVAVCAVFERVFARGVAERGDGPGLRNHGGQNVDPLKSKEPIGNHPALMHDEGCGGEFGTVGWNPTTRRDRRATGAALAGMFSRGRTGGGQFFR